jgi:hypothetical protein
MVPTILAVSRQNGTVLAPGVNLKQTPTSPATILLKNDLNAGETLRRCHDPAVTCKARQ